MRNQTPTRVVFTFDNILKRFPAWRQDEQAESAECSDEHREHDEKNMRTFVEGKKLAVDRSFVGQVKRDMA